MSTLLEQLVGAKALLEAAIETEMARSAPPSEKATTGCKHENRQEVTGAGCTRGRIACVDCGTEWEAE